MNDQQLTDLMQTARADAFEDGFPARVMQRIQDRAAHTADVVLPIFWRTVVTCLLIIVMVAAYNLSNPAATPYGSALERLIGAPGETTVLELYTDDIDRSL